MYVELFYYAKLPISLIYELKKAPIMYIIIGATIGSRVFLLVHDFLYWFMTFFTGSRLLYHQTQNFVSFEQHMNPIPKPSYSTVTLFAKFRGLSTSLPRANDA